MGSYCVNVAATSNATSDGTDLWVEILPPSGVSIGIKRVRLAVHDTTIQDQSLFFIINRYSTAGTGGTGGTIVKLNPDSPASVCTVNIKNGTTNFTQGSVVDVMLEQISNGRGIAEWIARDSDSVIWSGINQRIGLVNRSQTGSSDCIATVWWEE